MERMKPRQVAALALVGWYLMVPPFPLQSQWPTTGAPFSQWNHIQSFDTADACENDKAQLYKKVTDSRTKQQMADSECIEADDPRLKLN
jgi:hypothetical protein